MTTNIHSAPVPGETPVEQPPEAAPRDIRPTRADAAPALSPPHTAGGRRPLWREKVKRFLKRPAIWLYENAGVSPRWTFLYRLPKPGTWPPANPDFGGFVWDRLRPDDMPQVMEIEPVDEAQWALRVQRGDTCYTIRIEGKLASYGWVQTSGVHPLTEAGIEVPVCSGEFWIYDMRTAVWARRRGAMTATLCRMLYDHFEQGYTAAFVYVLKPNVVSRHAVVRAGFGLVAVMGALRIGKHYFPFGR